MILDCVRLTKQASKASNNSSNRTLDYYIGKYKVASWYCRWIHGLSVTRNALKSIDLEWGHKTELPHSPAHDFKIRWKILGHRTYEESVTGFLSPIYPHPDASSNVLAISVSRKSFSRKLYQYSCCMRAGKNRKHVKIRIGEGRVGIAFHTKRHIHASILC